MKMNKKRNYFLKDNAWCYSKEWNLTQTSTISLSQKVLILLTDQSHKTTLLMTQLLMTIIIADNKILTDSTLTTCTVIKLNRSYLSNLLSTKTRWSDKIIWWLTNRKIKVISLKHSHKKIIKAKLPKKKNKNFKFS